MTAAGTSAWEVWLPPASALSLYVGRMCEVATRRCTVPGKVLERRTLGWFIFAGAFMVVAGLGEYFWRGEGLIWGAFLAGWLCGFASFGLRWWAIAALGRFWSLHIEIRDQHEFIQRGPFRWVRHPTYLSMVLELSGLCLLLGAYGALVLSLVIFVPVLLWRVRLEEAALVGKFGVVYEAYRRSTPALLPYRWPTT